MRERRRGLPAALFVIASAALLAIWQLAVAPRLPDDVGRNALDRGPLVWIAPGVARHYCRMDLSRAELLVLGDSRVYCGIEPWIFEDAGLGETAVLHGRAARVEGLLAAARLLPQRRILLALAPAGLREVPADPASFLMAEPLPAVRQDGMNFGWDGERAVRLERPPLGELRLQVESWRARQLQRLETARFQREVGERALAEIVESLEEEMVVLAGGRRQWDLAGNQALDQARRRRVRTLEASTWATSWFSPMDPNAQDQLYRTQLTAVKDVEGTIARVTAELISLREAGYEIFCARLPVSPSLRAIEDSVVDPAVFPRLCEAAGLPFVDFGAWSEHLRDGSHLSGDGAILLSRELVQRWRER